MVDGPGPDRRINAVAAFARGREAGGRVIWCARVLVILLMTGDTAGLRGAERVVAVARLTRDLTVRGAQWQSGHGGMVPSHLGPRRSAVALLALRAELQTIAIVLTTYPVTVKALGGCALVDALLMARRARHVAMTAIEREHRLVVKGAVWRFKLRLDRWRPAEREDRHHEERAPRTGEGQSHGLWHDSQRRPSAPRCTSVWQVMHAVEAL